VDTKKGLLLKKIQIKCESATSVDVKELNNFQGGLKKLSRERFQKLRFSIVNYGFCHPISVWKDKKKIWIMDGHQRAYTLLELQKEGFEIPHIPISYVKPNNEAEARRMLLAMTSNYGEILEDGLHKYMQDHGIEFQEIKEGMHFSEINIDNFEKSYFEFEDNSEKDDAVPEVAEPFVKLGDLWVIGEHRMLCGDSTLKENVERLMAGEKADMVYTDPPYGMSLDTDYSGMGNTTTNYKPVIGDNKPFDPSCVLSIPADEYWLWGADYYCSRIPKYEEGSFTVWTKAHSDNENKVWTSRFELVWVWPKRKKEVWFVRSIQHLHGERTGEHPTQKPIELATRAFSVSKSDANLIVDTFLGSGSTLIACEKTKRKCYGMELDPHYCSVIIERFMKFTGSDAKVFRVEKSGELKPFGEIKG